jgi:hypothetical protein
VNNENNLLLKTEERAGVIKAVKKDWGRRVVNIMGKKWPMGLGWRVSKRIRMRKPSPKARRKTKRD